MNNMGKISSVVFDLLPEHETCWALTTAPNGKLYIGICGELTGGLSVFLAEYDPETGNTEYLAEIGEALGRSGKDGKTTPISKVHYAMIPGHDGKLYCATHFSGPPEEDVVWRPWQTWDDPVRMACGLALFTYDTNTGEQDNHGIICPNEGCRASCFAEKRRLMYIATWPRNHFVVYNFDTHEVFDAGRIGNTNPLSIWTDEDENGYTVDDLGEIICYKADEKRIYNTGVKIPKSPLCEGENRSIYDAVRSPDGKGIYGCVWNLEYMPFAGHIFYYDMKSNTMRDYGPGRLSSVNQKSHLSCMVFGEDGYLYYVVSEDDFTRRLGCRMYLMRLNPETGEKEEIGALDDGQWHSEYVAKATFDFKGNLYFADTNNRPTRLYVYRPETGERKWINDFSKIRNWG